MSEPDERILGGDVSGGRVGVIKFKYMFGMVTASQETVEYYCFLHLMAKV